MIVLCSWEISNADHETRVDIRLRVECRVNVHGESYKKTRRMLVVGLVQPYVRFKKRRYLTQYPVLCLGAGPGVRLFFFGGATHYVSMADLLGIAFFFVLCTLWSQTDSRDALSHCWAHGHPGVLPSTVGYSEAGQPRYAKSTCLCLTLNQ